MSQPDFESSTPSARRVPSSTRPRRQRRRVTVFVLGSAAGLVLLLGVLNVYDLAGSVTPTAGEPLYTYLATIGLFFLASALFLLYRLGASPLTVHYWALSLAAFCLLVFAHTGQSGPLDWLFYALDAAGRLLFPAILLHFVVIFPGERRPPRTVALLLYAPALMLGAAAVWRMIEDGVLGTVDAAVSVARLDAVGLGHMAAYLTAAIMVLAVRSARATTPSARRQLRWSAWGLGIGMTPFILFYLIPRALLFDTPPVAGLSVVPLIVLPVAFCTAVLKYRLADLGMFVRSGVTVFILTFFSLAVFFLVNAALRSTFGAPGIDRQVFTVLAGVFVFFLYPRLRSAVGTVVDRAFYQGRYDYRRTLIHFARELNSERELGPLLQKFHDRIRRTLPVQESVLLFPDLSGKQLRLIGANDDTESFAGHTLPAEHPLARRLETEDSVLLERDQFRTLPSAMYRLGLDTFFPMRVKGRVVAVLGVSMKEDEELNSEDRQLLETLVAHAAAAIDGARLAEENRERMREVERLKDHNESIVESTRVGILVVDEFQQVRGWNPAMQEMFGKQRGAVVGRDLSEAVPPPLARLLTEAPQGGKRTLRYNHVGTDGGARTLSLTISDLQGNEHGHGNVVTFDDLTEQLRLEQQLVQSERLASVGLLASGVAHEVNTPLTGISSYAQFLLEGDEIAGGSREILERIRKESWRASHIVNSLLSLARAGGADEIVDLNAVVEETLALFGPQLKGRHVDLRFAAAAEGTALLLGQKGRLQQVVLNLLMNARDAMPDGGTIRVSAVVANREVVLEVSDTGGGISPENLSRIYDPFFTTKAPGKGTGLGLSITYGIVRDHHGAIRVHSTPSEGTCFEVHFPAWRGTPVAA